MSKLLFESFYWVLEFGMEDREDTDFRGLGYHY